MEHALLIGLQELPSGYIIKPSDLGFNLSLEDLVPIVLTALTAGIIIPVYRRKGTPEDSWAPDLKGLVGVSPEDILVAFRRS